VANASRKLLWMHLYQAFAPLLRSIRSMPFLTRWLFHVTIVDTVHQHLWDSTTVVLRNAIGRYLKDGQRVLDLGTGHLGTLAVYCASIRNVTVVAVDSDEAFIENARKVGRASNVSGIDFHRSDWFADVNGTFDLIISNPPYIPTSVGDEHEHLTSYRNTWDGGSDGLAPARRILHDAPRFLAPDGRLLLGLDQLYVPMSAARDLVAQFPALRIEGVVTSRLLPSKVYVIGHKAKDSA
jgi:methylase of polypeptide subunit release factors